MKASPFLLPRKLLWASTLGFGFAMIWLIIALIAGSAVLEAWGGADGNWPPREELVFKRDGSLLIKSTPRGNPLGATYRDANNQAEPTPPVTKLVEAAYLTGGIWTLSSWVNELDWQARLRPFVDPDHAGIIWYFVHDGLQDGAGYFTGYDRASNASVGFIGESGFRSLRPPRSEWIRVRLGLLSTLPFWSPARIALVQGQVVDQGTLRCSIPPFWVYVPSGNRLRVVDLRTRTVNTAFQATEPIESFAIHSQPFSGDSETPATRRANGAHDHRTEGRPLHHADVHDPSRIGRGEPRFLV